MPTGTLHILFEPNGNISQTWVAPLSSVSMTVVCVGAGGDGQGSPCGILGGVGGGGGACSESSLLLITPGDVFSIHPGCPGLTINGVTDSDRDSYVTAGGTLCYAKGSTGTTGGQTSGGTGAVKHKGGNGANYSPQGGGGGGGANFDSDGANATTNQGGAGVGEFGGQGGDGGTTGAKGGFYGGGGGGGTAPTGTGGKGAIGVVALYVNLSEPPGCEAIGDTAAFPPKLQPRIWSPGLDVEHPLCEGLEAAFPLWEGSGFTYHDYSGNGFQAISNKTEEPDTFGSLAFPDWDHVTNFGIAPHFDGKSAFETEDDTWPDTSSSITLPTFRPLDDFTLSLWFNSSQNNNDAEFTNDKTVFSSRNSFDPPIAGVYRLIIRAGEASGPTNFEVVVDGATTDDAGDGALSGFCYLFEINKWNHVVVSRAGDIFYFYVNSQLVNSIDLGTSATFIWGNCRLGCVLADATTEYSHLNGSISQFLLWSRSLQQGEITDLYLNPWRLFTPPILFGYSDAAGVSIGGTAIPTGSETITPEGGLLVGGHASIDYNDTPTGGVLIGGTSAPGGGVPVSGGVLVGGSAAPGGGVQGAAVLTCISTLSALGASSISTTYTFPFQLNEGPLYYYRVQSDCRPRSACPVSDVTADCLSSTFVMILAHSLEEVGDKLRLQNLVFPVSSVGKFNLTARISDDPTADRSCMVLEDVTDAFLAIDSNIDFLLDDDVDEATTSDCTVEEI